MEINLFRLNDDYYKGGGFVEKLPLPLCCLRKRRGEKGACPVGNGRITDGLPTGVSEALFSRAGYARPSRIYPRANVDIRG